MHLFGTNVYSDQDNSPTKGEGIAELFIINAWGMVRQRSFSYLTEARRGFTRLSRNDFWTMAF